MNTKNQTGTQVTRREFLKGVGRAASVFTLGGVSGMLALRSSKRNAVWQIDPAKCTQCGQCATECVRDLSAVKCVHEFPMCGYCKLCFGFFDLKSDVLNEGAENQTCPTGALERKFVEEPYYEYIVHEDLCNGCGKCVAGCNQFGNGALYLQVRHDRCLDCNECSIAKACPADAFVRAPSNRPYNYKQPPASEPAPEEA